MIAPSRPHRRTALGTHRVASIGALSALLVLTVVSSTSLIVAGCGEDDSSGSGRAAAGGKAGASGSASGGTGGTAQGGSSGSAGSAGNAGSSGTSGGSDAAGGSGGSGDVDAAGPRTCTTDCSHCGPLEECFEGRFCVARAATVPAPGGGAPYAIDVTEVTRCQYAAWVATNPSAAGQDEWCAAETDLAPDGECMAAQAACTSDCDHHPQVCVTWCDAFAYCKAVGKRLCGRVGGGPAGFDDFADATLDQWYNACSAGGINTYPYGNQYDEQACNGYDNAQSGCQTGGCSTRPGGDVPSCQSPVGGYADVYDLSGNVFEWQDSCNATVDGKDRCRFRGASFISSYGDDNGNALRCNYDIAGSRDDRYDNLGFRCCGQ